MRASVYSDTMICNLALAEVPDKPIASLDEQSLQARECSRVYASCVAELLEDHPWSFALGRAPLTPVANDRSVWGFAYAVPPSAAYLGRVFEPATALNALAPAIAGYETPRYGVGPLNQGDDAREPGFRFELGADGALLYTDAASAQAEFTKSEIFEAAFHPLFVRALSLEIAARIVTPLAKDAARRDKLLLLAEQSRQRAKASDRNRQMTTWGDFTPEWVSARTGGVAW